jgi:hypothetical protein
MYVDWKKCGLGNWCDLFALDLEDSYFDNMRGVYIIWAPNSYIVRVGQGLIRDRLKAHRVDPEILKHRKSILFVTWAPVSLSFRDGVEKFLGETLRPAVGTSFPNVVATSVNLPWPW